MRSHRPLAELLLVLSLFALLPAEAAAQPEARTRAIDVNLFRPSTSPYGLFTTELTTTLDPFKVALGFYYDYQKNPLVIRSFGQQVEGVVTSQHTVNLLFAIGLPYRMEVGVDIPFVPYLGGGGGDGHGRLETTSFGDIRLTPKIQALKAGGFGLGFAATVAFPTGKLQSFHGERSVNVLPKLLIDYEWRRIAFTGLAGYVFRNRAQFNDLIVGSEFVWGAGFKVSILRSLEFGRDLDRLAIFLEGYGRSSGDDPFKAANQNPIVTMLGVRYSFHKQNLHLTVGGGRGMNSGYGANDLQLVAGLSWTPRERDRDGDGIPDSRDRCPTLRGPEQWDGCPDSDGDGIPDHQDKCPYQPGPESNGGCPAGDRDGDGVPDNEDKCPDVPGPRENEGCPFDDQDRDGIPDKDDKCPTKPGPKELEGCPDTDGDGIPDHLDKCPSEKGPKENQGCPITDKDGDGVLDKDDKCPDQPGPKENQGCPWPDKDGDRVPDKDDKCPDQPGPADNQGCPKEEKQPDVQVAPEIKVQEKQIVLPQINFSHDSSKVDASSHAALDSLATLLKENPTVKVRIEGHTDDLGTADYNLRLSQRRAHAVRDYLAGKGIEKGRLEAVGHGSTRPLIREKTPAARAKNRRVEFHITEGAPKEWKIQQ